MWEIQTCLSQGHFSTQRWPTILKTLDNEKSTHLVQNEPVQVRHVSLIGNRTLIIISKVFLQSYRIMRDLHHCAEVMGKHLQGTTEINTKTYPIITQ